jgi:hypothetical protein
MNKYHTIWKEGLELELNSVKLGHYMQNERYR